MKKSTRLLREGYRCRLRAGPIPSFTLLGSPLALSHLPFLPPFQNIGRVRVSGREATLLGEKSQGGDARGLHVGFGQGGAGPREAGQSPGWSRSRIGEGGAVSARLVKTFSLASGLLPARGGTGLAERPRHIEEVESAVVER